MTKRKNLKNALVMAILSMVVCLSMFVGTTFAWFTDSVTSTGNVIASGTLDVEMYWAKGTENPESANWKDASKEAIFNYDNWEPGYVEVRHIKIENVGSLALKYNVFIQANGEVSKLADVIDVYYADPAVKIEKLEDLDEDNLIGNLTSVLKGLAETGSGALKKDESDILTIALKMRESVQNEYQGLSIGSSFSVILSATQYSYESDSFDEKYDENAPKMFTVNGVAFDTAEEALSSAKNGDKVYLSAANTPIVIDNEIELTIADCNIVAGEGVNAITVNANATIIAEGYNVLVGGKNADGINVAQNAKLILTGKGNVVTKGNAGLEYFRLTITKDNVTRIYGENCSNTTDASYDTTGGSGIGVEGDIVIDGLANISAEGYGKAGYGIGGKTDSIVINNTNINYVRGGFECSYMFIHDWHDYFYGKKEPEGAPAIGSEFEGANIKISNSTIVKAVGGSKGAGIGARFHTGVNIEIENSNITAFGGNASAGIGGSRVSDNATATDPNNDSTIISIKNSTINATGGDYAAGIGSGYNTYADHVKTSPKTKVTIDKDSKITAQGGFLGAGIGTGHNVTNFEGIIECDITNVKAGDSNDLCCDGADTSIAQDIGDGVIKVQELYTKKSAGFYMDENNNYYVFNAAGLESLHAWLTDTTDLGYNMREEFWGKTYNIMTDIDASNIVWKTIVTNMDSTTEAGVVFNGNGHTINGLTIEGNGLFTGATHGTENSENKVSVFKNFIFDNVTVTGTTHHNGSVWGEVTGNLTLENVHVVNSNVSGDCNVGGLVGRNSESHSTITFESCSVKNTTVTARKVRDFAGASSFLGMALHIGTTCSANVVFVGDNVAEANTLLTAEGMQGGGIYTIATWDTETWQKPAVIDSFKNYNSKN